MTPLTLEHEELIERNAPVPAAMDADALYALPASLSQEKFHALAQIPGAAPSLNISLIWEWNGALDYGILREAFRLCAQRHEALRTGFARRDGELMQLVAASAPAIALPRIDLSPLPEDARSAEVVRMTRAHAAFAFDLRTAPLLALRLIRTGKDQHLLLLTWPHIISDGLSNGILMRDVAALYESIANGHRDGLPALPLQFADYALWQREWLRGPEADASREFWRQHLGSDARPLHLPHSADAKSQLPAHLSACTGLIESRLVPAELLSTLQALCSREGTTLNVFFFTAFCVLLAQLTGQRDFIVASPAANRTPETEDAIGLFMNLQAFRARLNQHRTFAGFMQSVHAWMLAAADNQSLPFEELVHDPFFLRPGSSLDVTAFFLFQRAFMSGRTMRTPDGALELKPRRSESAGASFEVMMAVVARQNEGVRLQWEYNPQNYTQRDISRYLAMYLEVLQSAAMDLHRDLAEIAPAAPASAAAEGQPMEPAASGPLHAAPAESGGAAPRPPSSAIERQLVDLWQATLGIPAIGIDAGFFSLGVSSLAALRLVTRINRAFSMDLGLADLVSHPSIAEVARLIKRRFSAGLVSPLVLMKSGHGAPLFFVHGVGGNIINLLDLARRLGTHRPVYGIQSQALLKGQPALLRIEDMAAYYVQHMRTVQPHGPYSLLGYSFGGTVAHEIALQLRDAGEQIAMLGMLDSRTLSYEIAHRRQTPVASKVDRRLRRMTGNVAAQSSLLRRFTYAKRKLSTRAARWTCRMAAEAGLRSVPAFLKHAYDINYNAMWMYRPRVLDAAMALFRATEQDFAEGPRDLGWGGLYRGGIEVFEVAGDHERIFTEPGVDQLAACIGQVLLRRNAEEAKAA